jgi:adenylate kinase
MVQQSEEEDAEPVEFPWYCEKGLAANIQKVKQEYCKVNNLVPVKIFINGPPLSGKTYFGEKLAEHYNVPLINLKTLIPELEAYDLKEGEENELITTIREFKKKHPETRYPSEIIYEMIQYRLMKNDCQQRGFVLDGYPSSYADAKGVFFHTLKKKEKPKVKEGEGEGEGDKEAAEEAEEEEEDPNKYKPKFMKDIYPESVIFLQAEEDYLTNKAKGLPKEIMKDSHYYENDMDRRTCVWNDSNTNLDYRYGLVPGKSSMTTARFFQEKETELLEVDASTDNFELFETMRIYIERHGRPFNYLRLPEQLNTERLEHLSKLESERDQKREDEKNNDVKQKRKEEDRYLKLAEERYPGIEAHVKDLEQVKDKKSREFLMKNIVPILSESMIDITKVAPVDPIDYMADHIFKKSNELHKTAKKN